MVHVPCVTFLSVCTLPVHRQAGVERVRDWLRHVRFSGERTYFTLHAPINHQPDALRAQCYVLQAVRFHSTAAEHSATVQLRGWDMTRPMLAALQGLPQWACRLVFDQCTWPLQHVEYRHMALHVPTSYTAWRVGDRYRECSSGEGTDSDSESTESVSEASQGSDAGDGDGQAPAAAAPAAAAPAGAAVLLGPGPWTHASALAFEASKQQFDQAARHKFVRQPGSLLESIEEGVCEYRAQLGLLPISAECADCP